MFAAGPPHAGVAIVRRSAIAVPSPRSSSSRLSRPLTVNHIHHHRHHHRPQLFRRPVVYNHQTIRHFSNKRSNSNAIMASPLTAWTRLIRYISAKDGATRYGEPILPSDDGTADIDALALGGSLEVKVLEGPDPIEAKSTGEKDTVKTLLGPLSAKDVPFVRCVGLNYKTHILETGYPLPKHPTTFTKPGTSIANTRAPVHIPKLAQSTCDYEGELTIVIGRDCKNATVSNALDYVAGYVTGNDVSCREWQMDKDKAGAMPQWSFSKSFDEYAPLGPCVVSKDLVGGDAKGLKLKTYVNGEVRQDSNTDDLCFGVKEIVAFCSQGTTLQKGSVIMTGTPGGVGLAMKPPVYLKDGDEVVVEIEKIGKVVNTMKFE